MTITVRVAWQSPYDNDRAWNELCAWSIEQFGMPNTERYAWRALANHMDFVFADEHDALVFQLYCGSSERVNTNQLTTEYFSKWL
jgi:hypothetical protein